MFGQGTEKTRRDMGRQIQRTERAPDPHDGRLVTFNRPDPSEAEIALGVDPLVIEAFERLGISLKRLRQDLDKDEIG